MNYFYTKSFNLDGRVYNPDVSRHAAGYIVNSNLDTENWTHLN